MLCFEGRNSAFCFALGLAILHQSYQSDPMKAHPSFRLPSFLSRAMIVLALFISGGCILAQTQEEQLTPEEYSLHNKYASGKVRLPSLSPRYLHSLADPSMQSKQANEDEARLNAYDAMVLKERGEFERISKKVERIRQKDQANAIAAEFFKLAPAQSLESLKRFIANNPGITLSTQFPAVQQYLKTRQEQDAPVVSPPPPTPPPSAQKELTPDQLMKLAEMKIANPAAYEEAIKMFNQAGYKVQMQGNQPESSPASNSAKDVATPPTSGGLKYSDLSYEQLLRLADKGDADAQFTLACFYYVGNGVQKNKDSAFVWLNSAAKQGSVDAMQALGIHYERGEGVAANPVESYAWRLLAQEKGNVLAGQEAEKMAASLSAEQISQGRTRAKELAAQIEINGKPKP